MTNGKKIVANTIDPEEVRVAILDEKGKLSDLFVERMWERQRTGEIYKARVDSVLPGMNAAFLNLGDGRNGFLYLNDARGKNVRPNAEMIVQVVKAARKGKGARVTPRVSLAGRYLVLVPGGKEVGISKRILDDEERSRLRKIARGLRPQGFGLIVRTVAEGATEENLKADVDTLLETWRKIESEAQKLPAPCLLYREAGLLERVLRDELNEDISEIIVDTEEELKRVLKVLKGFQGATPPEVTFYRGAMPLFDVYGIEREIAELMDRKVWLDSGAYLIIDQTEALTVIDVNTGKFIGSKDLSDTVFQTNMEAAEEIVRQLRLRAIGGIIVIDFIDMDSEEDRRRLISRLEELFKTDRCRPRVYGVTGLGLVEITRKRARPDLRSVMGRGCPFCGGLGWVVKEESLAMSIKRFIRKVAHSSKAEAMLLEAHPLVARYIDENFLSSWEEEFERKIFIREVPDFSWTRYRLDCQGSLPQIEHRVEMLEKKEEWAVVHRTAPSSGL